MGPEPYLMPVLLPQKLKFLAVLQMHELAWHWEGEQVTEEIRTGRVGRSRSKSWLSAPGIKSGPI